MAKRSVVELIITAKDQASGTIDGVSQSAGRLNSIAGAAAVGIGAMGTALAALRASQAVVELAQAADSANRLRESYDALAQGTEDSGSDMLAALRAMSQGAVSETDLVLSANRAMMLGVADSSEEMAGLMEVAAERGAAMGLTMTQAFNDIVTGVGRASPMILDNLGIVIDSAQVYDDYARSLGKTADELTSTEQKQALLNSVLREADGQLDVTVSSFEKMNAAVADAKIALGEVFAPAVTAGAERMAENLRGTGDDVAYLAENARKADMARFARSMRILNAELERLQAQLDGASEGSRLYNNTAEAMERVQASLTDVTNQYLAAVNRAPTAQAAFTDSMDSLRAKALQTAGDIQTLTDVMWENTRAALAQAKQTPARQGKYQPLAEADQAVQRVGAGLVGDLGAQGVVDFIEQGTAAVRDQREQWIEMGYDVKTIDDVLLPGYISSLDNGIRATLDLASATSSVSDEYSDLQSKVEGVISGAIGPVAGVNAEDFLPREDDVNENARRLADIMVNGLTGQDWLGEFAAEVPDLYQALVESGDPQTAAAGFLKDFQDGLRPELLDKDRAKELVKRAILGDQETAALVQEIVGDLAQELGISMEEASQAAAQVLGGGKGGGTGLGEALTDSVDGAAMVDGLISGISSRFSALVDSGKAAGEQWGLGFLEVVGENVPVQLIDLLANLVTPGVLAQLETDATLTGAQ